MKSILLFLCVFAISSSVFSQQASKVCTMKEGVMRRDGKTWYIKALTGPMTLDNGMIVNPDGTIKDYAGKTTKLTEGKHIDFQGSYHKMDGKRGVIEMDNNLVWVWSVLERPIHLTNGTYVMPDGTIRLSSGKYVDLKDKDLVDFDGNVSTVSL